MLLFSEPLSPHHHNPCLPLDSRQKRNCQSNHSTQHLELRLKFLNFVLSLRVPFHKTVCDLGVLRMSFFSQKLITGQGLGFGGLIQQEDGSYAGDGDAGDGEEALTLLGMRSLRRAVFINSALCASIPLQSKVDEAVDETEQVFCWIRLKGLDALEQ